MPKIAKSLAPVVLVPIMLASASLPHDAKADPPSFDCAKADSRAEQLVCGDRELAALDREATRLFRLVRDDGKKTPDQQASLNERRKQWLAARDECWISENLRQCVVASYARRIHLLREKYAEARREDAKGIAEGPFEVRCQELEKPVKATFIRSDPPVSAIAFHDRFHVAVGAGDRYVERSYYGDMIFETDGKQALIRLPDGRSFNCEMAR